jgi:hypothetical protein
MNLSPDGLCLVHDPNRAEQARAARKAGGKNSKIAQRLRKVEGVADEVPALPKSLDDAVKYFAWITDAIARGKIDARSGHEMAYALNGFKAAAEKRDLEREIKALRARLEAINGKDASVTSINRRRV